MPQKATRSGLTLSSSRPGLNLFQIADRFSEWEKQMYEKKELLMDGRFDNEIRTMNAAFYQLDEALRKILNEELEFDILRHGKTVE